MLYSISYETPISSPDPSCRSTEVDSSGRLRRIYTVTKQIQFCYGHRLLDYDGKCAHPHGHNGLVEFELSSSDLDSRGMVCDFSDIKSIMKAWIDEKIDHKMILREDDPLIEVLEQMKEPVYRLDSNPTAENIARLLYQQAIAAGFPVTKVTLWETADSFASYREP